MFWPGVDEWIDLAVNTVRRKGVVGSVGRAGEEQVILEDEVDEEEEEEAAVAELSLPPLLVL